MDVEPETLKFIEFPNDVFLERLEVRRSGSKIFKEASLIDLGASFPRTRYTHIFSSQ